ncbi:MAG: branched-chain amino acid ABC transporter permease [Burkholderiaceae bacterium]|nr:branched-chain amino acid ABC transporter permease [Burkholderiaceae bacterium]
MTRLGSHVQLLLAVATVLILPLVMHSGSLASEVLIYALAVLGCNLLLGYTGLLSFGQGSYALGIALTRFDLPVLATLVLAVVVGAVAAMFVGWFAIRQRGTYFVMLTLAFSQMFYFLAYSLSDITGGDNGLLDISRPAIGLIGRPMLELSSPWQFYSFVAVCFVLVFWALLRLTNSVFGRTLLAIRDNEARAAAVGYDVKLFKLAAFAISGGVTALAGAFLALMTGIAPLSSIEYHTSEMILVMTVIGGTGNLFASVLGAAFYVLFADWLSTLWPRWLMLLGFLLIAVSLFMHRGIWGLSETIWLRLRGCPPIDPDDGSVATPGPVAPATATATTRSENRP